MVKDYKDRIGEPVRGTDGKDYEVTEEQKKEVLRIAKLNQIEDRSNEIEIDDGMDD